jgi:hypothetical protein
MPSYRPLFFVAVLSLLICFRASPAADQDSYLFNVHPGKAEIRIQGDALTLKNDILTATWSSAGGKLRGVSFAGTFLDSSVPLPENAFTLVFDDGRTLTAATLPMVAGPRIEVISPEPESASVEEHFAGKRLVVQFEDRVSKLAVRWSAILRDGDNFIRQEIELSATQDTAIHQIRVLELALHSAQVQGTVSGSPITAGNLFLGFEHPLSQCFAKSDQVYCSIDRQLPLKAGQNIKFSAVIGISPSGQMRRGFLNYVERERAHPYRAFLHYNSWYDIGYGNRYDQAAALNVIHSFGEELSVKRAVKLDSFLFDDGWDDPRSLWSFDSGFPDGFTPLKIAAAKYGAAPGIWLSPWGGYDEAKVQRIKYGRQQGFEMNEGGFALSGPKYFARFRAVTLDFLREYGINQFKIDGTGNVNSVFPGSEFDSDFHAAISLIGEWRALKPDIFVNLTTGTFPSPFWLRYADSIWRGGEDNSFAGVGPWREKWITYRDADTYSGIVKKGPLFPLNSLMLHGIIYARQADHLNDDPSHAFLHEVRDYFGNGTQCQEMYITPALLSERNWDDLAEAATWSRRNALTLADTHWIGGDPAKLEVYGWASWSAEKGILTLRNPSDKPQNFSLDVRDAFELPPGAPQKFSSRSAWKQDVAQKPLLLEAGKPLTIHLAPFEVMNLEAIPVQ